MVKKLQAADVRVPLDVDPKQKKTYVQNFLEITKKTGRMMLFAGDQKAEHFNDDFCGEGIPAEDNDPEHLFKIANKAKIGVFAVQFGLVMKYGMDYPDVNYLIKVNSKTNLGSSVDDPLSTPLVSVEDIVRARDNYLPTIRAIGYTIYSGSKYESQMFNEAGKVIAEAHKNGLVAVVWSYPRGEAVANEKDPHLIAGAAGMAAVLGADFVKVNFPEADKPYQALKEAVEAGGRTRLVTAGGSSKPPKEFLEQNYKIINTSGAFGNATGRNIHQKSLAEAVRMANALAALTYDGVSAIKAYQIYKGK